MIDFSISKIIENSPYEITLSDSDFIFKTDLGVHYRISFEEEDIILGGCTVYQFILQNVEHLRLPHDPKVELTVLAIINEFFRSNQDVLLYICDTSDGKEEIRNRLFLRWFDKHATPGRFTICTAKAKVEHETIYAAIIVENTNPKLSAITSDFEKTAEILSK
jgi:hypothetical protein